MEPSSTTETAAELDMVAKANALAGDTCPQCGSALIHMIPTDEVVQCSRCSWRTWRGEPAPRIVVSREWGGVKLALSEHAEEGEHVFVLDPALAIMVAINVVSALPDDSWRIRALKKLVALAL